MTAFFGRTNVPVEFSLRASRAYEDIFNDVEVDVVFTGPDGETWRVPAFWAGGEVFKVRFAAPRPGRYTFESKCTNAEDGDLHGRTGDLEIELYDGPCALYRHGAPRVAATRRTFEHADGTPFLWLGDTWWMGLSPRLAWPHEFRELAADRAAKGFNVIQIVVGPWPDYDLAGGSWHPGQGNEAGFAWEKGWERINPGFYDLADMRLAHLVESGLVPCIVSMWGYYLTGMGIPRVKRHWRNLVARYGAFPVVWCLAGEVNLPTYSLKRGSNEWREAQDAQIGGWTDVARYLREIDPCCRPVTAHPWRPNARAMLRDDTLLDFDMLQTGHGGYRSLTQTVEQIIECNTRSPRMPVLNGEVNYESIMGGSWQEIQRFCFWTSIMSGSCGHTYGAQGIWGMNSRHDPFVGTTAQWGSACWQDAMHFPGSKQLGIGRRFLERYPWWRFEPREEPDIERLERVSAFGCGISGRMALFYMAVGCVEERFQGVSGALVRIEPEARYEAFYFDPRTGAEVREYPVRGGGTVTLGTVDPDEDGFWPVPDKPTMEDWVLVLEDRDPLRRES